MSDNVVILVDFDEPGLDQVSLLEDISQAAVDKSKAGARSMRRRCWVRLGRRIAEEAEGY